MNWRAPCAWSPAGVVMTLALIAGAPIEVSAYKMCALRDGPRGPCTCQRPGDPPGQFSAVSRSRCKDAAADKAAQPAAEQPGAGTGQGQAAAPAAGTDTTGTGSTGTGSTGAASGAPAPAPAAEAAAPADAKAEPSQIETGTAAKPADAGGSSAAAAPAPAPAVAAAGGDAASAKAATSGKLAEVRARGSVKCGVNRGLPGFAALSDTGTWSGLDIDFCRAVAAAVFGDAGKAELVPIETSERFDSLRSGAIDVLSRNTTWTMGREMEFGIRFAGVLYFDGQGFLTTEERGLVSAQQLAGSKVCVEAGTTSEKNVAFYFKSQNIAADVQAFPNREGMLKAYYEGACDSYSGDRSALFSDRSTQAEPLRHVILPEIISKEPLGPAVLDDGSHWEDVVRWTLAGLINAEEVGLDKQAAAGSGALSDDAQRLVEGAGVAGARIGLSPSWLRDVVRAVGNYGELYDANLGKGSPLGMDRGLNALWKRGGILIAPPMW